MDEKSVLVCTEIVSQDHALLQEIGNFSVSQDLTFILQMLYKYFKKP